MNTKPRLIVISSLLLCVAIASPRCAGNVVFRDDFEAANGDIVSSAPNVGGANIGQSWSIKNEAPGVIDVANASVASGFPSGVPARPGSGDQYLRLYRPGNVGSSSDGLFEFTSPISSGKFQVNYSLYNKTPVDTSHGSQMVLGAGSSDSIPPSTGPINLLFRPNGSVGLFDQSLSDVREILPVGSYALDSWQDVAVTLDIDRQSFDLAIGSARIEAVPFPISHSDFSHGLFSPAHNSVSFVDDVVVKTFTQQPPFPVSERAGPRPYDPLSGPRSNQLRVFNAAGEFDDSESTNPTLPTVVLAHGWNSSPAIWEGTDNDGRQRIGTALKEAMERGEIPLANVIVWDWHEAADTGVNFALAGQRAVKQGQALGVALLDTLGVDYEQPIHFLGHSYGAVVDKNALEVIHDPTFSQWDRSLAHVTNLDGAEFTPATFNLPANRIPVPTRSVGFFDNYVSAFADIHDEAVNVLLLDNMPASVGPEGILAGDIQAFHSLPTKWYRDTVLTPFSSAVGHRFSFERGTIGVAPPPGTYFEQVEGLFVEEVSRLRAEVAVTARSSFLLSQAPLTLLFLPVDLITGADILGTVSFGTQTVVGGVEVLSEVFFESDSPAYTWLTIDIPSNAAFMSFDLDSAGLIQNDFFGVAIQGTELLTVYGDDVETGIPYFSGLIDVSLWAGMQVELFMGLESNGTNNQSVWVHNLSIYSVPEPNALALAAILAALLFVQIRPIRPQFKPSGLLQPQTRTSMCS